MEVQEQEKVRNGQEDLVYLELDIEVFPNLRRTNELDLQVMLGPLRTEMYCEPVTQACALPHPRAMVAHPLVSFSGWDGLANGPCDHHHGQGGKEITKGISWASSAQENFKKGHLGGSLG